MDPGHFQVESDLFNVVIDHTGGVDTDTYLITNPTLKYGLTRTLDLEASLAPLVVVTTHDRASGASGTTTGIGDLYLRAKWNLVGDDGGPVSLALLPYVKAPTARLGIGNGAVEGGLLVPVSISLPAKFSLALTPEVDLFKNADGNGRHANMVQLVALGHALGPFSVTGELWSDFNFDPDGRGHPIQRRSRRRLDPEEEPEPAVRRRREPRAQQGDAGRSGLCRRLPSILGWRRLAKPPHIGGPVSTAERRWSSVSLSPTAVANDLEPEDRGSRLDAF